MKGKRLIFSVINDLNHDQRMIRICGSLTKAGYRVKIWGLARSDSQKLKPRNYRQRRFRTWFQRGRFFYAEYNLRLFFLLLFSKADAFCAVDLDSLLAHRWAARLRGKKLVYDAHEWFPELPELVHKPRVAQFWKRLEKKLVPKVDLAYTVSQSLAKEMTHPQTPFHCIRNVPLSAPIQQTRETATYLFYQGALNLGRGLEAAILALKKRPALQLRIAGEGDLSQELRALCKELDLEKQVFFLGKLSRDQLLEQLNGAWLGLNLLDDLGASYRYSLANKFFDYVQSGIPQLCINFPEYAQLNAGHEVAFLLNVSSEFEIGQAIDFINSNPAAYNKMKEACLVARKKWIWEEEEKLLLSLYDKLFKTAH